MEIRMKVLDTLAKNKYTPNHTHSCPKCGGGAYCAIEDGKSASACWCMGYLVLEQEQQYASCLCEKCFKDELNKQIEDN